MGVPSFFWWLLNKYRKTLSDALEPRGEPAEFDNFYIDLNEIIHPCFRADYDLFPPTSVDEIFSILCNHIDRLFRIVRPRKLLFIAIDGVASRAKMYQIRSGRYSNAKSDDLSSKIRKELRQQFEREGKSVLSEEESQGIDPTVITPGTEFMQMLSEKLRSYICLRMSEDSAWGNLKVILSDDKVAGEGEHKIMSFIRAQRTSPGYDPNTRHCVYGTDIDLIMLALATHEVHFSILREEPVGDVVRRQVSQFLNVCLLREYLALDLEIPCLDKCEYDLERLIDDFIFICFLAGNDFLHQIYTLRVPEGCIDLLMHVYKEEFHKFGGYLVDMQKAEDETGGYINFKGVERFILTIGAYEEKILSKRSQIRNRKLRRALEDRAKAKDYEMDQVHDARVSSILAKYTIVDSVDGVFRNTVDLELKTYCYRGPRDEGLEKEEVKFDGHGWRERYYKEKFSAETAEEIEAIRNSLIAKFGEGLCWLLLCYFSGVPSWSWFYPYHYGPLASDMEGLSKLKVEFKKGLPFKPFDQLMGVLPPSRAYLLPEAFKALMLDKNSRITDFYHKESNNNLDGKSYLRLGMQISIIEEERLLSETEKLESELKEHEKVRNTETLDRLFVKCSSELGQRVLQCFTTRTASDKIEGAVMVNSIIEGIRGVLHLMPEDDDNSRDVVCMFYEMNRDSGHIPKLLRGVNIPQKTVTKEDVVTHILWHEQYGNGYNRFQNKKPEQKSRNISSQGGGTSHFGQLKLKEDTNSSLRPNYGGSWRRDGYGGSGSRKESDTNLDRQNSRGGQGGSSFFKSRSDASDDWRSDKQSRTAAEGSWHNDSAERSAQRQHPNDSCRSNMSNSRWR